MDLITGQKRRSLKTWPNQFVDAFDVRGDIFLTERSVEHAMTFEQGQPFKTIEAKFQAFASLRRRPPLFSKHPWRQRLTVGPQAPAAHLR